MPIYTSDALILRTYKLGEADRIVVFLTRDRGKKRGVAKGARRAKSRFGGGVGAWRGEGDFARRPPLFAQRGGCEPGDAERHPARARARPRARNGPPPLDSFASRKGAEVGPCAPADEVMGPNRYNCWIA